MHYLILKNTNFKKNEKKCIVFIIHGVHICELTHLLKVTFLTPKSILMAPSRSLRHGESSGSFKSLMGHLFSAFIGDCVFKIVVVLMCYVIFLSTKSLWCALWRKSVLDKLYSGMRSSAVGYEFNIYELMYTLNKISLNRSIHKNTHKKGYVLISMLWPEVHRNITLYFL